MLTWTDEGVGGGLVAIGESGRAYWLEASLALKVRPGEGDRSDPIALFVRKPGGAQFRFRRAFKSINDAVSAAKAIEATNDEHKD